MTRGYFKTGFSQDFFFFFWIFFRNTGIKCRSKGRTEIEPTTYQSLMSFHIKKLIKGSHAFSFPDSRWRLISEFELF